MKETGLTPKLLEVAQRLASGQSYSQISEAVSVPRSTIGRWAKMEAVKAEVAALKNEAIEAHRQISREAATEVAQDLRGKLAQSMKRQEVMITQGYSLAAECFDLTQKMLTKASEIFKSNKAIEPHEKILISSLPVYMRVAGDMVRNVSDAEDKLFGIEEIAKRLDEWQQLNNSQN